VKEIESGERDKSAAAMDERMSASRREGRTGTSEADLPKDAASLYWYDAESTSYLSTEADNRRATEPLRYRRALWNLPVSTSFLCVQLAPKGGIKRSESHASDSVPRKSRPGRAATLCPWS
jgi:hypothetical protein